MAEREARIEEQTGPLAPELERLEAVPGVDRYAAEVVLAEAGARFPPTGTWLVGRGLPGP
jgi:hypothetical protein